MVFSHLCILNIVNVLEFVLSNLQIKNNIADTKIKIPSDDVIGYYVYKNRLVSGVNLNQSDLDVWELDTEMTRLSEI